MLPISTQLLHNNLCGNNKINNNDNNDNCYPIVDTNIYEEGGLYYFDFFNDNDNSNNDNNINTIGVGGLTLSEMQQRFPSYVINQNDESGFVTEDGWYKKRNDKVNGCEDRQCSRDRYEL